MFLAKGQFTHYNEKHVSIFFIFRPVSVATWGCVFFEMLTWTQNAYMFWGAQGLCVECGWDGDGMVGRGCCIVAIIRLPDPQSSTGWSASLGANVSELHKLEPPCYQIRPPSARNAVWHGKFPDTSRAARAHTQKITKCLHPLALQMSKGYALKGAFEAMYNFSLKTCI